MKQCASPILNFYEFVYSPRIKISFIGISCGQFLQSLKLKLTLNESNLNFTKKIFLLKRATFN